MHLADQRRQVQVAPGAPRVLDQVRRAARTRGWPAGPPARDPDHPRRLGDDALDLVAQGLGLRVPRKGGAASDPRRSRPRHAGLEPGRVDRHVVALEVAHVALGVEDRAGMPRRRAPPRAADPSPVLPEPVMPTITPCVVSPPGRAPAARRRSVGPSSIRRREDGAGGGSARSSRTVISLPGSGGRNFARTAGSRNWTTLSSMTTPSKRSPSRPASSTASTRSTTARSTVPARRPAFATAAASSAHAARPRSPRQDARDVTGPAVAAEARSRARTARDRPVGRELGQLSVEGRVARAGADPRSLVHHGGVRGDRRVQAAHELRVGDVGRPILHAERRGRQAEAREGLLRRRGLGAQDADARVQHPRRGGHAGEQRELGVELDLFGTR